MTDLNPALEAAERLRKAKDLFIDETEVCADIDTLLSAFEELLGDVEQMRLVSETIDAYEKIKPIAAKWKKP